MSYRTDLEIEKGDKENVISLFGQLDTAVIERDLSSCPVEVPSTDVSLEQMASSPRKLVADHQSPDQSIYTLQEQLKNLKLGLQRLKFYLDDLDDVIPR